MTTIEERLTYEEWVEVGNKVKAIATTNQELWFRSRLQPRLNKKLQRDCFEKVDQGVRAMKAYLSECAYRDLSHEYENSMDISSDCFYDVGVKGKAKPINFEKASVVTR